MKKKTLILMIIVIIFYALPVVSIAANQTELNTVITYTIESSTTPTPEPTPTPTPEPNPTPEPESPPITSSATYEINIPATISLNDGNEICITSNYMNLNSGQNVVIYSDTVGYNGWIDLPGTEFGSKISVSLNRRNIENGQLERIYQGDVVARFDNNGIAPAEYGSLYVIPFQADVDYAEPGTYTGTLRFKVEIVNN